MSVPLPQPPPSLPRRGWLAMVLSPLPGVIPPTAPLATLWEPALQSQYVDIVVYMFIVYCQLVYQIHLISAPSEYGLYIPFVPMPHKRR